MLPKAVGFILYGRTVFGCDYKRKQLCENTLLNCADCTVSEQLENPELARSSVKLIDHPAQDRLGIDSKMADYRSCALIEPFSYRVSSCSHGIFFVATLRRRHKDDPKNRCSILSLVSIVKLSARRSGCIPPRMPGFGVFKPRMLLVGSIFKLGLSAVAVRGSSVEG